MSSLQIVGAILGALAGGLLVGAVLGYYSAQKDNDK